MFIFKGLVYCVGLVTYCNHQECFARLNFLFLRKSRYFQTYNFITHPHCSYSNLPVLKLLRDEFSESLSSRYNSTSSSSKSPGNVSKEETQSLQLDDEMNLIAYCNKKIES